MHTARSRELVRRREEVEKGLLERVKVPDDSGDVSGTSSSKIDDEFNPHFEPPR